MPSTLPVGEPVPADGHLPDQVLAGASERDFGLYIHIPFCTVRCGYCDFNTYTREDMPGVAISDYHDAVGREIDWAKSVMSRAQLPHRPVSTVFFGGGTPSLLATGQIEDILGAVSKSWGIAPGAEVTLEANPDSLDLDSLDTLVAAGVTRFSVGMQSANPEVLAVLDRTHRPDAVPGVVQAIKESGAAVSVDVIYGSPGETPEMWRETLDQVIDVRPDHVSAYSLIVEPGTALQRRISRGEVAGVDDDVQAQMYEEADTVLAAAGYSWYEVSNWSLDAATRSRHNLGYWRGEDWWGIGPGAHSHIGGVRWWNAKHPSAWVSRLTEGVTPAVGREVLDLDTRRREEILLRIRTIEGLPASQVPEESRPRVAQFIAEGLIDGHRAVSGTLVLTRRGRLLADHVSREIFI
jgi:putative oxygen-independent coproporphyrinogen III oxidase